MSPVAAGLAAVLHVATAFALFWVSPLHGPDLELNNAIEVTIEQPKPPEPKPEPPPVQEAVKPPPPPAPPTPPAQPPAVQPAPPPPPPPAAAQKLQPQPQPQPQQASKEQLGLPPKGVIEPDKKPEAKLEPKPTPPPEPKPEPPQEAAAQPAPAEPTPPPPPEKPLEKALPPVEAPAAPLSMRDFVKVLPPPPAPPPSPPAQRPPPPQQHAQQPQPSPLSPRQTPQEEQQASVSEFRNPAAAYSHARTHDDYLIGIARRMSEYRFVPKSMHGLNTEGVVVLSLVVSRDGRLVNSAIAKSSGNPPMDLAVLETAQKASPYGPVPSELSGNTVTFMLSVPYKFVAGQ